MNISSNQTDQQVDLNSARSAKYNSNLQEEEQRDQDLQLLIRAHERVRQLQQQNDFLVKEVETLSTQLKVQRQKNETILTKNVELGTLNEELLSKILQLEKQLLQKSLIPKIKEPQPALNDLQEITNCHPSKRIDHIQSPTNQNRTEKVLKASESTPVILNINLNPCSKQQRDQFLFTCKQEFSKELEKIQSKSKQLQSKHFGRNKSQYFEIQSKTPKINDLCSEVKKVGDFVGAACREFQVENCKTIKNIQLGRKKSTSSSGLRRNNFQNSNTVSRTYFGDKTNIYNSKGASVNEILSKNNQFQNGEFKQKQHLRLQSTYASNDYNRQNQRALLKKGNRSIYFSTGSDFSYGNQEQNALNERKRKQVQMELRNKSQCGIIKYRGLCL